MSPALPQLARSFGKKSWIRGSEWDYWNPSNQSVFLLQVNDSEDLKGLLSGSKRIKRTADHREQGSPYYEFKMPVETIDTLHLSRTPFFVSHAIVRVRKYRKYITVQRLGR